MTSQQIVAAARRAALVSLPALAAVLLALLPASCNETLQYDRMRVRAGELHRLVTCHFTHWNGEHAAWDTVTFAALALACSMRNRRTYLATLVVAAIGVSSGIFIFQPQMTDYRGLSGLDSALFALLAVDLARHRARARQWTWVVALAAVGAGFVAKIAIEIHYGAAVFVQSHAAGFVPVPLAHLLGAIVGTGIALIDHRIRFDFDQRIRVDQPRDFDDGGGGPDVGEDFPVHARHLLPAFDIGHVHPRADDVLEMSAQRFDGGGDDLQRPPRLLAH
jgi:rhomboid family GlyGly-CTERM serine protease